MRDACLRFPMMAERQLVVLREAQTWKIDQFDKLAAYFKKPTPTTVLVIQVKHKKVDGRRAWLKDVKKHGPSSSSKLYGTTKCRAWIQGYVKFQKRRIGEREALLLAEHLGSDLARLTKQVEKLCIMAGEGEAITGDPDRADHRDQQGLQHLRVAERHRRQQRREGPADRELLRLGPKDHPLVLTVGMLNAFFTKVALVHAGQGKSQGSWPPAGSVALLREGLCQRGAQLPAGPAGRGAAAAAGHRPEDQGRGQLQRHGRRPAARTAGQGDDARPSELISPGTSGPPPPGTRRRKALFPYLSGPPAWLALPGRTDEEELPHPAPRGADPFFFPCC